MIDDHNKGSLWAHILNFNSFKEHSSSVFAGNHDWDLRVYTNADNDENEKYLGISLRCNKNCYTNLWSCNASVRFTLPSASRLFDFDDEDDGFTISFTKKFTRADNSIELPMFKKWEVLTNPSNNLFKDNHAVVKCSIVVNSSDGFKKHLLQTFDEPKENLTDVVLLVEGKKVHVGKQILALHSRYFEALFFSNFKESTEKEIPIEDVIHLEFIDLLNLVYPSTKRIDYDEVEHLLKLADRFEMWTVIDKVESFLIDDDNEDAYIVENLICAEKYKLAALQDKSCEKLKSIQDVFNLTKDERYNELGADTHGLLFRRLVEIQKECADNDN